MFASPKQIDRFQRELNRADEFRGFYAMLDHGLKMAEDELSGSMVAKTDVGADFLRGALVSGELLKSIVEIKKSLLNLLPSVLLDTFDEAVLYWREVNRDRIRAVVGATMPASKSLDYILYNSPQAFVDILDKALVHAESLKSSSYYEARPRFVEDWAKSLLSGTAVGNLRHFLAELNKLSQMDIANGPYAELMCEYKMLVSMWIRKNQSRITSLT